ncbi:hypothetical protein AB0M22_15615 [Nocardia sp. NPDC051756]|uniref:hypothetical protein n=1 Tax=Nocardia sp. NPDC051756 TaxID=3154751 RepID=UPI003422C97F
MTNSGFFNHYDDPDEFWDDEPLDRPPKTSPNVYTAAESARVQPEPTSVRPAETAAQDDGATATDTIIGAGLFQMILDDGRLPVQVNVDRNLHARLHPRDFAAAAMTGYYAALWRHDAPIISSGNWEMLSARPSRRSELIALLNTRSLAEFEMLERVLRGHGEFIGNGPLTEFGSPSIEISASISRIEKFDIHPGWAAGANPSDIGYDIIECANQIRDKRPHFHEGGAWSGHAVDQLEENLREYVKYLQKVA